MKTYNLIALPFLAVVAVSAQASLIHAWELNGDLTDSLGGSSLIAEGGTVGATAYSFAANQGLLDNSSIGATYTLSTEFSFDETSGYRKIWDYQDKSADAGLYNYSGSLVLYPQTVASGVSFSPGQSSHVVLTRDGATKRVAGFANGAMIFSFIDTLDQAAPNPASRFFEDDTATGQREASAGSVDYIRIYDNALGDEDARVLSGGGVVPEPASMIGLGLGAVALLRRRSKK